MRDNHAPGVSPGGKTKNVPRIETDYARATAIGTLQLTAAEGLGLLLGFGISFILTRRLGPELYGLYSVAVAVVLWVELSTHYMFHQATIKFLAEASDWEETASALIQAALVVGIAAAALLAICAPALAAWLKSRELTLYLCLLALDIPLYTVAHGHRSTLIGRGAFGSGALPDAVYWLIRFLLVVLLTGLGFSVTGAILAIVGASVMRFFVARLLIHPPLLKQSSLSLRPVLGYALPLFLHGISMRLIARIDLLFVQALSGSAAAAGYYGAAQNLAITPLGTFATSISSPLLATVARLRQAEHGEAAQKMIGRAMHLLLCLLPFAALAAGASMEIVHLAYGGSFLPTASLFAWLIFGGVALIVLSACGVLFTAAGKPGVMLVLTGPLLPLVMVGHWLFIPRYGPIAAAAVTTIAISMVALVSVLGVCRLWRVRPPLDTALRSSLISAFAYLVAARWHTPGFLLFGKLLAIALAVALALLLLGEFSTEEMALLRSLLRGAGGHKML
jgi:O-antigen/teichoic acid export membrane protein